MRSQFFSLAALEATRHRNMIPKAVVIMMLPAACLQASVIYNFVGTGVAPSEPVAFQLTVPTFANPPLNGAFVDFSCSQLDSSTNCNPAGSNQITFSNQSVLGAFSAQLTFLASNGPIYGFFFPTGAFGAPGVYSAETGMNNNPGTLTVTQTPEPTTTLLAFSGFCLCVFRRLQKTNAR